MQIDPICRSKKAFDSEPGKYIKSEPADISNKKTPVDGPVI